MTDKTEKKPLTISFKNFLIQIVIIIFFTSTWLSPLFFNSGVFNIWYFLFMFIGIFISATLTLYSKANPEQPIPKKPTQQFTNLIKVMTDIITSTFVNKETPAMNEIKAIIQKALVWSIREAKISPEFDRPTLELAEKYILDKLFPKEEKKGEEESQQDSQTG